MARDGKTKRVNIIDTVIITFITVTVTLLASGFVGKLQLLDQKVDKEDYNRNNDLIDKKMSDLEERVRKDREETRKHIDSRFEDFKDFMIELNKKKE